jgi:NAD(P)-dependent dehydrogenase (short-subunit alcohol dehydrogenase family)
MDLGLSGRVALVTGGSLGLGRAAALRLAEEGAAVAVCARRPDPLRAVVEAIEKGGGRALATPADVTRADDLARVVATTLDTFGRLDILVNNAGTSAAHGFEALDDRAWQEDLELKLFAAIRLTRLCVPHLARAGSGRIINILNVGSRAPAARSLPTSVSRAAGLALTKALSRELAADRILVNAILIGVIKSAQWERRWERGGRQGSLDDFYRTMAKERGVPLGRMGEAEELGALVAFLASQHAAYITGVAINLDGGLSPVP